MLTGDRLTDAQIRGLETWLAHVDPHDPVCTPQLVIDAMQALIEEVREWRAGALGADDVDELGHARELVLLAASRFVVRDAGGPAIRLLDRMLAAHGAKP